MGDCKKKGGHLLDIGSDDEWTKLKDFIKGAVVEGQWVWLGAKTKNKDLSKMTWGSGKPVNLSKVKYTKKYGKKPLGDCLNSNGKELLANHCGFKKPYICEYK